ncbi:chaplin family protein [Planomonospora sp. ID82291]|uniref:chaplin family protein n=1 Tax=Planomonospora sp. ID82291 TaxID=2738136 RepID=UPI001A189763|nr:chaplin family protein [Planomonospora sp. ID82291]MBG0814464.1 chaplin [Planomonospora sp. ID82291]
MRTWVKSTTPAALLALGVMSLGTGTAFADDTSGDGSIGGGNQVNLPITLPIDISGNSVAVIGESEAGSVGGASVEQSGKGSGAGGNRTSGERSILGGNQVVAPITAPVNVCGNAVAVIGRSAAGCKGGASVEQSGKGSGAGGNRTSGERSILGGNQVVAPITAPVNVCGNAVGAVVGQAFAGCKGGASVKNGGKPGHGYHGGHGKGSGAGDNRTSGRGSVLGGNQVVAPITAPVNVCGNAVGAVIGQAFAGCKGGASVKNGGAGAGGNRTSGERSILGGNQVVAPITAPVNVCGNAVAVLADAAAGCLGGAHVGRPGHGHGGHGYDGHGHDKWGKRPGKHTAGLLPALPVVPALNGAQDAGAAQAMRGASSSALPAVDGVPGLAELPNLSETEKRGARHTSAPADGLRDAVPGLDGIGLMSAAQPAGVTGMTSGSLLALVVGAMAAASATLFATTRRVRFGKHKA